MESTGRDGKRRDGGREEMGLEEIRRGTEDIEARECSRGGINGERKYKHKIPINHREYASFKLDMISMVRSQDPQCRNSDYWISGHRVRI